MVNQIRTTGPSVTAIYADIERARAAMMTLERAGIDGNDIKLDEPSAQRPRTPDTSVARDTGVGKRVAKFSIIGGLIGGAAGVLAGVLVGVLLLDGGGVALWSAIAGMAFVGLSIGGVLVPMVVIGQGPNWEQTFEPAEATGQRRNLPQRIHRQKFGLLMLTRHDRQQFGGHFQVLFGQKNAHASGIGCRIGGIVEQHEKPLGFDFRTTRMAFRPRLA